MLWDSFFHIQLYSFNEINWALTSLLSLSMNCFKFHYIFMVSEPMATWSLGFCFHSFCSILVWISIISQITAHTEFIFLIYWFAWSFSSICEFCWFWPLMVAANVEMNSNSNNDHDEDPLFISNSEHPVRQLTSKQFSGSNCIGWSWLGKRALVAKVKLGFIAGSCSKPADGSASLHRWLRCDNMVTCWLLNSMI